MVQDVKKLRVLVICQDGAIPPEEVDPSSDNGAGVWRPVYDVCSALRDLGHEVSTLGIATGMVKAASGGASKKTWPPRFTQTRVVEPP